MHAGEDRSDARLPNPLRRGPTGLRGGVTLFLALTLLGGLLAWQVAMPAVPRPLLLERPIASATRVFERRLALEAATEALPGWERAALAPFLPAGAHVRDEAIAAFGDLLEHGGYARPDLPASDAELDGLRARRIVLLASAGRLPEAQGDLDALAAHGQAPFVAAARQAWSGLERSEPVDAAAFALAGEGWIGQLARARALGPGTAPAPPPEAGRMLLVARVYLACVACGLALLLAWVARNRPDLPTSTLALPPPWTPDLGLGVLVRAAFLGLVVALGLDLSSDALDSRLPLAWSALLVSLPLLVLVRRHLLAPAGLDPATTFGARPGAPATALPLVVLALFALQQLGERGLGAGAQALGAGSSWVETVDESLVWGGAPELALRAVDLLVWAPVCVELAFRGVLFPTLRGVTGPLFAAGFCSALYGALTFGSPPALLAAIWSGFVLSLSVERTRSLLPAVLCQVLTSAFALAEHCALYR